MTTDRDDSRTRAVRNVSRRTVARGAAWLAPTVAIGATAPAFAASQVATLMTHRTSFLYYPGGAGGSAPWCVAGQQGYEFNTSDTGAGVTFAPSITATTITNVYAYFWFPRNDLVWTRVVAANTCWSIPLLSAGVTDSNAGITYYRYATNYTCAITAVNGTTTLQAYRWQTQCFTNATNWDRMRTRRRQAFSTVNGTVQSTDTGYITIA